MATASGSREPVMRTGRRRVRFSLTFVRSIDFRNCEGRSESLPARRCARRSAKLDLPEP